MDEKQLSALVIRFVTEELRKELQNQMIPVAISARHIHLTENDFSRLFGTGAKLNELHPLSQTGQFAAKETVDIVGPKRALYGVRILGPFRKQTQSEISLSDAFVLGINPPVRESGDIKGSAGAHIVGPHGAIKLDEGIIIAARHIHMSPDDARRFGVKDKQLVAVNFPGKRAGMLEEVIIRVDPNFKLEMHVDTDEGNAINLKNGEMGTLITNTDQNGCIRAR